MYIYIYIHTYTHTSIHIYIYIYIYKDRCLHPDRADATPHACALRGPDTRDEQRKLYYTMDYTIL